ncbi:hypothetical protein JAAARDRAFT_255429 [Jaapia argillacea MUCL 33604]|uniref:Uncharacterized protein n=1 Tax=Jaapia argillacea MUCL 33604 TaxID=933084 RepID=A0A067Q3H7_9AGAM|nr:hypothetical protein JAAARDRAFT_255429 [Jaapia argillacea MUCL 33604]
MGRGTVMSLNPFLILSPPTSLQPLSLQTQCAFRIPVHLVDVVAEGPNSRHRDRTPACRPYATRLGPSILSRPTNAVKFTSTPLGRFIAFCLGPGTNPCFFVIVPSFASDQLAFPPTSPTHQCKCERECVLSLPPYVSPYPIFSSLLPSPRILVFKY